jgi:hypothetical protein
MLQSFFQLSYIVTPLAANNVKSSATKGKFAVDFACAFFALKFRYPLEYFRLNLSLQFFHLLNFSKKFPLEELRVVVVFA